MKKIICILILSFFVSNGFAQFKAGSFMIDGFTLPYKVMYPKDYDKNKTYPLVVFLHGAGERGNDNEAQLTHGKQFLIDNFSEKYPAIVIAPQCPQGNYWPNVKRHENGLGISFSFRSIETPTPAMKTLVSLIEDWLSSGLVDTSKVYVGGLSMGGMGTFELLWRMPQTFAAAFPICGGSNIEKAKSYAKNTALWIFHGADDSVVPVERSVEMYNELKRLGAKVKYTEYEGVNHNSWDNAFREEELVPWLFSISK